MSPRPHALSFLDAPASWLLLAAAVVAIAVAAVSLLRLSRQRSLQRRASGERDDLAAALATIHTASREVAASFEIPHVARVLDHECRKFLDVDFIVVALIDETTRALRVVHHRSSAEMTADALHFLAEKTAGVLATRPRDLVVDDFELATVSKTVRSLAADDRMRSALASSLVIEDQVIGFACVQSFRPNAYTGRLPSSFATMIQQAALAIANARRSAAIVNDSISGFPRRDVFLRRMQEEHARAGRNGRTFVLCVVELDRLPEIAQRHGRIAGDIYLRAVTRAIRAVLRQADLACRFGGDQIALLLPDTELGDAVTAIERLRANVAELVVDVGHAAVRGTITAGLAAFPEHDAGEVRALLRRADEALLCAKRLGSDRIAVFAGDLDAQAG